jgi:thiol-disulfide isomerase/thioredoxin
VVDQDGTLLLGDDLKGKTVFINLWATWCPPCIAEMPDINKLYNDMSSDDIVFLMISLDDDFSKAKNFVQRKEYDFEIYQFASNPPASLYSKIIPTTFVLSPEGNIVVRKQGMAKYNSDSFKEFLKSL